MKKLLPATLLILGFLLGASALSAVAGTWTAPTCTPPGCNTEAPINASSSPQTKYGPLTLNFDNLYSIGLKVLGKVQIVDGNQAAGKVLTSDASGIATWASVGSTPVQAIASSMEVYDTAGSYTWTVPVGANFARVTVVGSGIRTTSGSQQLYTGSCDGGLAIKSFTLGSSPSMSVTVGGNSSVTYGAQTVTATAAQALNINSGAGPCAYGVGQNGALNGRAPYYGYGSGGNSAAGTATGGIVVIEYY